MADLQVMPGLAEILQNNAGFREKLEHTGAVEKKGWPQCHKVSSWQELTLPKVTDPSIQIVRWERVKVSESCTLTREQGQNGSIRRKKWTSQ